jgi:glycosyltransferase involved in cell wall biosynthesis
MIRLSICIATFKRGAFIAQTLESIVSQLEPGVELVVVNGASPDDTHEVVAGFAARYPELRYVREPVNSGVDQDYDKAVGYARGQYCWLMTDDDLLCPGAVARVLALLDGERELVVVNSQILNADFSRVLEERFLKFEADREYRAGSREQLFSEVADYLSFIGGVVIRRDLWLARQRSRYFGSLFIHVGVIFQSPALSHATVIAEPLIHIRYGNAMWTARGFDIWMFKWPQLVWSFGDMSADAKRAVCRPEPWRDMKRLLLARAVGSYSGSEYREFLAGKTSGRTALLASCIAHAPATFVNFLLATYCVLFNRKALTSLYDIARSPHATWASRVAARLLHL